MCIRDSHEIAHSKLHNYAKAQEEAARAGDKAVSYTHLCKIKSYSLTYECIKGYGLMNW